MPKAKTATIDKQKVADKTAAATVAESATQPMKKKHHWLRWCLGGCGTLVLLFALLAGIGSYWQYYTSTDDYILANYNPTAQIEELATENKMTRHGTALFYSTDPEFVDTENLKKNCANKLELLMGCLGFDKVKGGNNRRIYLLDLANTELSVHKYSTAAHEMLHQAYFRFSAEEKKRIDSLIEAELPRIKALDPDLEALMSRYEKADLDVTEELYCRFATEYETISPELEEHFKKYFEDRDIVYALFEKYDKVFSARQARIDQLAAETDALNAEIQSLRAQWEATSARLNFLYSQGRYSEYNRLIPTYNSQVNAYNAKIDLYNAKANERNALIAEIEFLYKLIDPNYKPSETVEKKA